MAPARRLTTAEAAEAAGCCQETIRRAVRRKELLATKEPTRRGRGLVILTTDLAAWLERRRVG